MLKQINELLTANVSNILIFREKRNSYQQDLPIFLLDGTFTNISFINSIFNGLNFKKMSCIHIFNSDILIKASSYYLVLQNLQFVGMILTKNYRPDDRVSRPRLFIHKDFSWFTLYYEDHKFVISQNGN
jgi:hypothetical protein